MTGWDMVKMDGTEWDQRGNWIERNWTAEYGTGRDATEGGGGELLIFFSELIHKKMCRDK